MSIAATARTLHSKRRNAERLRLKVERQAEVERRVAAMSPEELEALRESAMEKLRIGLRRDYYTLTPEIRRIADRLGVMDDDEEQ